MVSTKKTPVEDTQKGMKKETKHVNTKTKNTQRKRKGSDKKLQDRKKN